MNLLRNRLGYVAVLQLVARRDESGDHWPERQMPSCTHRSSFTLMQRVDPLKFIDEMV